MVARETRTDTFLRLEMDIQHSFLIFRIRARDQSLKSSRKKFPLEYRDCLKQTSIEDIDGREKTFESLEEVLEKAESACWLHLEDDIGAYVLVYALLTWPISF
jgi:hypothetical protein